MYYPQDFCFKISLSNSTQKIIVHCIVLEVVNINVHYQFMKYKSKISIYIGASKSFQVLGKYRNRTLSLTTRETIVFIYFPILT